MRSFHSLTGTLLLRRLQVSANLKSRDRLFLYVLVILVFQFFQIAAPSESSETLTSLLERISGFKITIHEAFIRNVLWFGLLSVVIRYFQTTVTNERQYQYVQRLENTLTRLLGDQFPIEREGRAYLLGRPRFTRWLHYVYTWIFPILLLATTLLKIAVEFPGRQQLNLFYFVSISFCSLIWITTLLYLHFRIKEN